MKIVTLGLSPYLLTAHARIHSEVLKLLYFSDYEVAGIVWGHDTSYFLPKKNEKGELRHYYEFEGNSIPIIPFNSTKDPSIAVYEVLQTYKPDMLISIGDYNDILYMKAVKMFSDSTFKWIALLANYSSPINEKNIDLVEDMDGILCTNEGSFNMLKKMFKKDDISMTHVGCCDLSSYIDVRDELRKERGIQNKFRIMVCGKNMQADNVPTVMKAVAELRSEIPEIELYAHSNVYDAGDYDLNLVRERFDPKNEFIKFPDKYVSLTDGYSADDFEKELVVSDIFVSASLTASSGFSVFDAISSGCLPVMSNTGCHRDIAAMFEELLPEFKRNDFLVPCIEMMAIGETYLDVCDPQKLKRKIIGLYQKKKNKKEGHKSVFREFVQSHHRKMFFKDVITMIEAVNKANPALCVESV